MIDSSHGTKPESSRILITGSRGTVGTLLEADLAGRGHFVVGCDLGHDPSEAGFSVRTDCPNPSYVRCDVGEYRQVERVVEEFGPFDLVFHCAAEFGRWNGEDFYESLWRTNAVGTKNVIRLQESRGFRLVHFSSSEVYGDWPNIMAESVMDEHEIKQLNDYAMSKWVNEMQVRNSIALNGTESVIVRLFNTYGPGEHYSPYRSVNCRFTYCALHGIPWVVYRGHSRTSTYLADAVRTIANLTDHFKPGEVYNIGGGEMHTIEELSDLIVEATGADPALATHKESEVLTTKVKQVDVRKSVRDLDHRNSVDLREGIRRTVEWMREEYSRNR